MKRFLTITLFFYCMVSPAQQLPMEDIRNWYQKAATEKNTCEELINQLSTVEVETNPLLFGYRGSATMMMAQHVSNPFSKLSYFHKGKNMLDEAISADQKNMELRFLRFAAQTEAPAMLGYRGEIEEDKKLILHALPASDDRSLRQLIIGFLVKSEFLEKEEKEKLTVKV
jgi:hypothetical protein